MAPDAPDTPDAARFDDDARRDRRLEIEWYANWFEVGHNALQFKIDCARSLMNESEEPTMYIRVTSDALRARQLFQLLGAELIAFMDVYGPIAAERTLRDAP
jgi:hypothetical protein